MIDMQQMLKGQPYSRAAPFLLYGYSTVFEIILKEKNE